MSMTDPIADMLTRVRNALQAEKASVSIPASRVKTAIAKVLTEEGYVDGYAEAERDGKPMLEVILKYFDGRPVIEKVARVSTPGRRVYRSVDDLPSVIGGLGVAIISTSKGIMTERAARAQGIGGEVLCVVY